MMIGVLRTLLLLAAATVVMGGCTTVRTTDPPKTATEQFLTSVAAANAVRELTAEPLRGRAVFIDETYFPKDQQFALGEIRAHLLLAGIRLTNQRDQAEIIVEPRTGGIGIDRYEFLLGIPSLPLGAVAASAGLPAGTITTPELALIKNTRQWGTAGIAYVAYWRESGEILTSSGPEIGRSFREDWWFFGWGPNSISNIPPTQPLE